VCEQRPAYHLAASFQVSSPVTSAVLRITAHGIYEAFLNGQRIGDHELSPGFTAYRSRISLQTFDVTNMVTIGRNSVGALLSDGWWRGQHGVIREIDAYGPHTALLAQLDVRYADDTSQTIVTDESWRSTPSHILRADLIAGEVHDFRCVVHGWCDPMTDRSSWDAVRVADHGYITLCDPVGPPIRRIETLAPVSITHLGPGRSVVDFGQNINGWVRLTDLGPAGTTLTLVHGEALVDGDVTIANVATAMLTEPRELAFQTDVVISAGGDETFEPRHSTKGFRYLRIEGHPGPIGTTDISAVVVHSDLAQLGAFRCSDDDINRLHEASVWALRGNVCGLPTDCPTRERSGWVGDWQIYVDTAAELYDVTDFSVGWLKDLAADQFPDGKVTSIVPDPSPRAPGWGQSHGSSGWGDAAVHVPWELYRATGRTDFIAAQLPSMCAWVDFAAKRAATRRHPSRIERPAEPLPHEQFIWDSGWHFGEWLIPGEDITTLFGRLATDDHGIVATAYLYRSADELGKLAALVGQNDTSAKYATLAANVLDAWRTEFIDNNGNVRSLQQADLVRALAFELVPSDLRSHTASTLVEMIRSAGTHLGTGFLATPFLLPVLADTGHIDVAYALLFQRTDPSWLYMLDHGATTVWEDWNGVRRDGVPALSLNHYSKGAVIGFLHRYTAGLRMTQPGWKSFVVEPRPGGGITSASYWHDSLNGRISVDWTLGDSGNITVTVPPATSAELRLPDGSRETLVPGSHQRTWQVPDSTA
jgi:alpha-L-rhamnosidase